MKKLLIIISIICFSCSNDDDNCRCREFENQEGGTDLLFACSDNVEFRDASSYEEAFNQCN